MIIFSVQKSLLEFSKETMRINGMCVCHTYVCMYVRMCACMWERKSERVREREREVYFKNWLTLLGGPGSLKSADW